MSKYNIKHLPKSQIEVSLEIEPDDIAKSYDKSLKKFVGNVEVKGFRKGKAPSAMVEATVGREKIYEDAINAAIPEHLETALKEEAQKNPEQRFIVLDYPQFSLGKEWKQGEPLAVTAICSLYPKIDVKNIVTQLKVEKGTPQDVSEKDIQDSIEKIFEQYKNIKKQQTKEQGNKTEIVDTNGEALISKDEDVKMDDNFAKAAGAKDLEDLKRLVGEELKYEQQTKIERDFEEAIIKKALELVEIDLPDVLVNEELNRIEQRFRAQLDRLGISFDSYLTNENKTADQIRSEWATKAQENTKIALILNEWRVFNNLVLTQEEIERVLPNNRKVSQQEYESIVYMLGQTKSLQHLKDHAVKSDAK